MGHQSQSQITVIIPVHNGSTTIRATLDSVMASETLPAEIIVVDDGSTDDTAAVVERFFKEQDRCRLLRQIERRGAAAARNLGTAEAVTDLLLFTDSDVVLEPDAISHLLETIGSEGPAAAVGVYRERNLAGGWLSHFTTTFSAFTYLQAQDGEPTNFGSQCVMVRKTALEKAGGFDQDLAGATVEDLGLGYRLRAAGGTTILSAEARMSHNSRFNLVKFWRNYLVKSRVFTQIRTRTPRRYRRDGGYDQRSIPFSIILSTLGWSLVLVLPFHPAVSAALVLQQLALLILWRKFLSHTIRIFGLGGAVRLFLLKQLALTAVGAGALSALLKR